MYCCSTAGSGSQPLLESSDPRAVTADVTAARVLQHRVRLGITRVADVTGLDCLGIPVVMVTRPNSRSLSVSQGKGLTLDRARASGLMEALELACAEHCLLPLRWGSLRDVAAKRRVADVTRLPRTGGAPLDPARPLLWADGSNLFDGKRMAVPYELVHMNYALPLPPGSGVFAMSSNGLASGNTWLEAVVHALCEVIERDATTLWYCRSERSREQTRVDLSTVSDHACCHVLERLRAAGLTVAVWDVTSDVRVPAFRCLVSDDAAARLSPLPPVEGMGCALRRELALLRALLEAVQVRLTAIVGARDDNHRSSYRATQQLAEFGELEGLGHRDFAQAPTHVEASSEDELAQLMVCLNDVGITELVSVDLTDEALKIPVYRVIVPGLEGYHHVPGVSMGARARAVCAREMAG